MSTLENWTNVQAKFDGEMIERMDSFRQTQPGGKTMSRSQVLRILVDAALEAAGFPEKKRRGQRNVS
jgi:hypothetical protein